VNSIVSDRALSVGGFSPVGLAVTVGVICVVGVSAGCLVGGDAVEARWVGVPAGVGVAGRVTTRVAVGSGCGAGTVGRSITTKLQIILTATIKLRIHKASCRFEENDRLFKVASGY